MKDALPCNRVSCKEPCATAYNSPTIKKRPESLLTDSLLRVSNNEESILLKNECVCKASENIQEGTEIVDSEYKNNQSENEVTLGSQSTLASDRAGARLVHASHNPTTYSNHSESKEPIGSPIWKPRHGSKHVEILKSRTPSEDAYSESKQDEDLEHLPIEPKQRVAFRMPHVEFQNKGTDC